MSVSTEVQTEGEDGSEKTESPASLSPRTSSLLQRSHDGIVMEGEDGSEKTESLATLSPRTSLYEGMLHTCSSASVQWFIGCNKKKLKGKTKKKTRRC